MTRNTQNYWIDWVLFITMMILFLSGFVLWGWSRPKEPGQLPQIFWGLMEGREFLGMGKKL